MPYCTWEVAGVAVDQSMVTEVDPTFAGVTFEIVTLPDGGGELEDVAPAGPIRTDPPQPASVTTINKSATRAGRANLVGCGATLIIPPGLYIALAYSQNSCRLICCLY